MAKFSLDTARKLPLVRAVRKPFPSKLAHQVVAGACMVMEYDRLQGWLVAQIIPLR